jgi:hypothetical protein
MPWSCARCLKRTRWCHWCRVRHCACRPHVSRAALHRYRVLTIRRADGVHRLMSSRRFAHLKGAQKGGQTTATRPNPGRFNPETARKAALARWLGRHKANPRTGLRPGVRRKRTRPEVSRRHLRYLYSRTSRLGIRYLPLTGQWMQTAIWGMTQISETTALRRLGHLPYDRKNWVPGESDLIVAETTGTDPAHRKGRRRRA